MEVSRVARWVGLPMGVSAISTAGVLIRLTTAPPLLTASHRMVWASALLLTIAALTQRRDLRAIHGRTLGLLAAGGLFLGLHFALWTNAVFWTSVASAVLLVDTHPIFVALAARALLNEATPRAVWAGIGLTLLGSAVVGAGDFGIGGPALVGDAMAATASVCFAGYLVIGRHMRQALSLPVYAGTVYAVAAVILLAMALASGTSLTAFSSNDLLVWLALVLVPTLGGHTVLNWTLRHVPASVVGVSLLGEPVAASFLAWLVLGEAPPATAFPGGALILVGLYVALRTPGSAFRSSTPSP